MRSEPSSEAHVAARLARAYAALSPFQCATLATELCAIERAQRRHAERCCSGEDGGYTKRGERNGKDYYFAAGSRMASPVLVHDPDAEQRAGKRIERKVEAWMRRIADALVHAQGDEATSESMERAYWASKVGVTLEGDPRGAVLRLTLPGEQESIPV